MRTDHIPVHEYRTQLERIDGNDQTDDPSEPKYLGRFADFAKCNVLSIRTIAGTHGPCYFGYEGSAGQAETLFCDVLFVKGTMLPPLKDRMWQEVSLYS